MKKINMNALLAGILLIISINTQAMMNEVASGVLLNAVVQNDVAEIRELIALRADVNYADEWGNTPLILAAQEGHIGVVKILLEHGALVNARTKNKVTALWKAAFNGHAPVVRLLLENGASVNMANKWGVTPLLTATQNKHLEVVKILLAFGANANIQAAGDNNRTALTQAADLGHIEIVIALLTMIPTADAEAYFVLASSMKKNPALQTNADTRRMVMQNFLDALIKKRQRHVLRMIALRTKDGKTAREIALKKDHYAIADLLDISTPETRERILKMVEANVKQAIRSQSRSVRQIKADSKEPK